MKFYLHLIFPVLGSVLLLFVVIWVREPSLSAAGELPYQASASAAATTPELSEPQSEDPAVEESDVQVEEDEAQAAEDDVQTAGEVSPSSTTVSVVAEIQAPVVVPPPVVAIGAAAVIIPAPLVTSPVGAGGTIVNLPIPVVVVPLVSASTTSASTTSTESTATTPPAVVSLDGDLVCVPEVASASLATDLVINEIFADMSGADTKEFIEIFNPTNAPISLASSSLQYLSGTAAGIGSVSKKNFPPEAGVPARGYYLIGTGDYDSAVPADMLWSQSLGNTGATVMLVGNQVVVTGAEDPDIIDRIAYGSGTLLFGWALPAQLPPVDSSLERKGPSQYEIRTPPQPQNTASPASVISSN